MGCTIALRTEVIIVFPRVPLKGLLYNDVYYWLRLSDEHMFIFVPLWVPCSAMSRLQRSCVL